MRISTLTTSYTSAAFSSTRADLPWHFSLWAQPGVWLCGSSNLIFVWRLQTNTFCQHAFSYCFLYSQAGLRNVLINKAGSFKQVLLDALKGTPETQALAAPSRGQASQGGNSIDSLKHLMGCGNCPDMCVCTSNLWLCRNWANHQKYLRTNKYWPPGCTPELLNLNPWGQDLQRAY